MSEAGLVFKSDGSVHIEGILVFSSKTPIILQEVDSSKYGHSVTKNHFITYLPKCWQLRRWINLYKTLRRYTKSGPGSEVLTVHSPRG